VSNESKVLVGVGAGVVLGVLVALAFNLTAGLFVMLIGVGGAIVAMRFVGPKVEDPFAQARSEADETQVGNITPNQPLSPWSPDGGLNAWTPPVSYTALPDAPIAPAPMAEPPVVEPTPAETSSWSDSWSNDDDSWNSAPTATWESPTSTETNPLDDLQGLDTLDPIAEVERIEARTADDTPAPPAPAEEQTFATFSFGNASAKVNEDVADADDIMAASQATELHLAAGEQTELQKLLAKVQIRLSAYE
jgi:hypothetical protein